MADIVDELPESAQELQGVPLRLMTGEVHILSRSGPLVFVLTALEQQLLASQPAQLVAAQYLSPDIWSRCLNPKP